MLYKSVAIAFIWCLLGICSCVMYKIRREIFVEYVVGESIILGILTIVILISK